MQNDATQPQWGLRHDITPCFGARLVQEGKRLHCLNDRTTLVGGFSERDSETLDTLFPLWIKQLEQKLRSGELSPSRASRVMLSAQGFTCEADTLGSCGYVYLSIYPVPVTD